MDEQSINDMKNILAAMNGGPSITEGQHSDASVDAMKDILMKMNSVQDTVHSLQETARYDLTLREALDTDTTDNGARIGSWEIVKHDGRFDVTHATTGEPIARDLMLYEAAVGLARRLNEGVSITDKRVREVLQLEEDYARNRDRAAVHKRTVKEAKGRGDEVRAAVAEDRFDEAQARALEAHDRILRLAGLK